MKEKKKKKKEAWTSAAIAEIEMNFPEKEEIWWKICIWRWKSERHQDDSEAKVMFERNGKGVGNTFA